MSDNINFDYKNLSPFKWYVLENFPFIEADFDALTNWQLFCKLGKEINKIINSVNVSGEQVETLTTAFNNLQNYVNNYFDNLDVQEEINNKLDEMIQDGTIANILNDLVLNPLNNTIILGDSYTVGRYGTGTIASWADYLIQNLGLQNTYKIAESGAGFIQVSSAGHTFLTLLQSQIDTIENKESIQNFIICAGYNECDYNYSQIVSAMREFVNYAKTQFPNAKFYFGMIGNSPRTDTRGAQIRHSLSENVLKAYKAMITYYNAYYLDGVETILKNYNYFTPDDDNIHPNAVGQAQLAYYINQALINKKCSPYYETTYGSIINSNLPNAQSNNFQCTIYNNMLNLKILDKSYVFSEPVEITRNIIPLGTINIPYFRPNRNIQFNTTVSVGTNLGTFVCPAMITIANDCTIQVSIYPIGITGTVTTVNNVFIIADDKTIPVTMC